MELTKSNNELNNKTNEQRLLIRTLYTDIRSREETVISLESKLKEKDQAIRQLKSQNNDTNFAVGRAHLELERCNKQIACFGDFISKEFPQVIPAETDEEHDEYNETIRKYFR